MAIVQGQCRCGEVRYRSQDLGDIGYYACHCHECQRLLGTAFALNLPVRKEMINIDGAIDRRDYSSGPGRGNRLYMCPRCQSHLFYANSWRKGVLGIRAGSVSNLEECEMLCHIWTASKQPWLPIASGAKKFLGSPSEQEWREVYGRRNLLYD